MTEPPRKRQRRHLNYDKCRFCRNAKKACTPVERTWPQKCQRCIELELECSENSRAPGAPASIPAPLSNQAMRSGVMCELSLRAMWLGRLNFYHKAANAVWDDQQKLFSGWRDEVGVLEKHELIHFESTSYYNELSKKMVCSDDLLAVFVAHTLIEATPLQCVSPFPSSRTMVDRSRRNGDVSTALAMQEIMLLHHPKPMSTVSSAYTEALSKYCNLFQETIECLELTLGRKVPAVPPLHYHYHLTKQKELTCEDSRFVFMKDYYERSLLHVALDLNLRIGENHLSLLKPLASAGDTWGRRPIHIACTGKSSFVMKSILDITTDCDVEDCLGRSALHYASSCGDAHAVTQLIGRGAKVNHKDREGRPPLSWAIERGHTSIVKLLLKCDADLHFQDQPRTALLMATLKGSTDIVELLLEHGADINHKDREGRTPLSWAVEHNHTSTVQSLLKRGADANFQVQSSTALLMATLEDYKDIVETLLEHGADLNYKDQEGETPISWAIKYGLTSTVKLFLKSGADANFQVQSTTPLLMAAFKGNTDTVEVLLEHGADVNGKAKLSNTTALHLAARYGHNDVVHLLLRSGAKVNEKDSVSNTPLHLAARHGHDGAVELLLRSGAQLNEKNKGDDTALILAVKSNSISTVELLLRNEASVEDKNQFGNSALSLAVDLTHLEIIRIMLGNGVDVENLYDDTAVCLAVKNRRFNIIQGLL